MVICFLRRPPLYLQAQRDAGDSSTNGSLQVFRVDVSAIHCGMSRVSEWLLWWRVQCIAAERTMLEGTQVASGGKCLSCSRLVAGLEGAGSDGT
jgi:hypothetical protein